MEETFTLEEIKKAFWSNFHEKGEFWFCFMGSPDENMDSTNYKWNEFKENLMNQKT